MTPEDIVGEIVELAAPYGAEGKNGWQEIAFAIVRAAITAEREACAQECDDLAESSTRMPSANTCALRIRARK